MLEAVTVEFVTTNVCADVAKFTLPAGLLIVFAPVEPEAVFVAVIVILPALLILNKLVCVAGVAPVLLPISKRFIKPDPTEFSFGEISKAV